MAAQAVAAVRGRAAVQAEHPADGGVQPVGGDDVAEPFAVDEHRSADCATEDADLCRQLDAEVRVRRRAARCAAWSVALRDRTPSRNGAAAERWPAR